MILSPGVLLIQLLACHRYTRLSSFCLFSCSFSGSASYFHLFLKEGTSTHCNICLLSPNHPSFPVLNLTSPVLLWMSLSLYFPLDASSYFQEEPTNSVSLFPCNTNTLSSASLKYSVSFPLFFYLFILSAHWAVLFLLCLLITDSHWRLFINEYRWQANDLCAGFTNFLPFYAFMCIIAWSWQS